jgi:glutathione peroxidase
LFENLSRLAPGILGTERVKWNYTKFLVNLRNGRVRRYSPTTRPEDLRTIIEASLGARRDARQDASAAVGPGQ